MNAQQNAVKQMQRHRNSREGQSAGGASREENSASNGSGSSERFLVSLYLCIMRRSILSLIIDDFCVVKVLNILMHLLFYM